MKVQPLSAEKRSLLEKLLKEQEAPQHTEQPPALDLHLEGKDAFVLSFSQRRLWFLDQLEPGSAFYNFPLAVPFNVAVNAAVLQRSINEIVRRHEALRTVFDQVDGEPVQVVLPEMTLPLDVVDLRTIDKESQNAELTRLAAELAQRPFDLASGPLLRTTLLRRGPEDNVFLLVIHHIVSDGWSLGIFWRELVALYNAFYVSRPSPLPELPIQYADFAVWQRDRLRGESLDALLSYWRKQLDGMPTLQLPTDRPRPAVPTYRGAFHEISIPRPLNDGLRALAQREGATLFMTLFAVFTVLLLRYTGQQDVVVGSYVAGRDRAELEGLIGFFINSLVLRADLSGDPSFRTLLARVREMALDAYAHQELPFEKLVEELQPERDLGRNPLFQVSFQLFSAQLEGSTPGSPEGAPTIDLNRGMAIFDIAVNIWDGPDGLSGHVEYSTDLFEPATIARLIDHYRTLLKSVVAEPDARISTLTMLGEAEQHRLLAGWNDTRREFAAGSIHELFEHQVERSPDAVAVSCDGDELTYAELNRRANRLARGLRLSGLERGAPVGLCVGRSARMMVAVLAVLKAGGAFVPLDPSYPTERLEFMLKDSGARIVILEQATAARLAVGGATTILLDDENVLRGEGEANLALELTGDDLCYLLYTSGSTGRPKGVLGMHRGTTNRLHWMWEAYPFEPGEVVCQKAALSFVDSIWEMFGGLLQGVKTVVLGDAKVADPRLLVKALAAEHVTRIVMVPSLLRVIMASGIDLAGAVPALKYWTLSGEALPYDLCVDFRQDLPHARLLNLYGSSEVAADVLCCDLSKVQVEARAVPIGRPIANTQAYILNGQGSPVPIGVPGELYIGGQAVARGYHERPDLTADSFVRNPFGAGMLYRTRDQVRYRPDGEIEYLGRLDHQVKIRGYRIELGEIEAALEQHEWVDAAAASVVQSGGDPRLIAHVVAEPEAMSAADGDQTGELASRWRSVWNDTYLGGSGGDFDTVGWNSSYSSEPLSAAEMHEWVEQTVARVASLRPRRVLEIGCGTGMLLLRLAGQCVEYAATDFSPVALDNVRREIAKKPEGYRNVTLFECAATDFTGITGPFDVVILNSVIQYFPSIDYLFQVLRGVLALTTPDARIFIGDVRSQPLLEAFHASVELAHAPDNLPSAALRARIHKQVSVEKELAVDPKVFHALGPDIAQVTVDLKRGTILNEVMQFRYDVCLRRKDAELPTAPLYWLDWRSGDTSLDRIRETLSLDAPDALGVLGVPNSRIAPTMQALDLMSELATAGELRRAVASTARDSVDPEALWALGAEMGYEVSIGWRASGGDGCFDVVFRRGDGADFGFPSEPPPKAAAPDTQATAPLAAVVQQALVSELRTYLQQRLPNYMVPTTIILLDRLPLTANGKIDRRALPAPDATRDESAHAYVAPRNRTERMLADIWIDLLNIERVGVRDNFFDLGGHSLLATQLVSRIRNSFDCELPVRAIFEAPTIASLAAKFDKPINGSGRAAIRPVSRAPRAAPVVAVPLAPGAG